MTLKDRMHKLRGDNPLFTVADLVEITIYGDSQDREGDFLAVAAQVLHCSQSDVDDAVAFTGEASGAVTPEDLALADLRNHIANLPEDVRIRVEEIASTFRARISADPMHAGIALALVGAEEDAK